MALVRLMTLNLRRDVPADGPHRWGARRDLVVELVEEEAPHILGTQEGLPHQLADLDAKLTGYTRVGGCRRGDNSDEACAIYYSRDRFERVASGDLWLSDTPGVAGSAHWGNRLPRIVTWAQLRDRVSGRRITAANTHFDHESPDARERAARFLAERLPGALILGDLNAEPGEPPHAILLEAGWHDGDAREPTYHGFDGRARMRLDHVLLPRTHRFRAHRVVSRARDGVHASDHHAVVADIEPAI